MGEEVEDGEIIEITVEDDENFFEDSETRPFRTSRDLIDSKLSVKSVRQSTFDDYVDGRDPEKFPENSKYPVASLKADLTPAQDRAIFVLCSILADKSQSTDQSQPDYYMGNYVRGFFEGPGLEVGSASIETSAYEIAKRYFGKKRLGKKTRHYVVNELVEIAKKNYELMIRQERLDPKTGKPVTDVCVTLAPLFQVGVLLEGVDKKKFVEIFDIKDLAGFPNARMIFRLHPAFTNCIRTKYVEFPEDIHLRIHRAAGGKGRISQCVNLMRDFLFREKQSNRFVVERNLDTLIEVLGLSSDREAGRKKRVKNRLEKAFSIFLKIGLLERVEQTYGAFGQPKIIMHINREFR